MLLRYYFPSSNAQINPHFIEPKGNGAKAKDGLACLPAYTLFHCDNHNKVKGDILNGNRLHWVTDCVLWSIEKCMLFSCSVVVMPGLNWLFPYYKRFFFSVLLRWLCGVNWELFRFRWQLQLFKNFPSYVILLNYPELIASTRRKSKSEFPHFSVYTVSLPKPQK